jgi:hypothetical protein
METLLWALARAMAERVVKTMEKPYNLTLPRFLRSLLFLSPHPP